MRTRNTINNKKKENKNAEGKYLIYLHKKFRAIHTCSRPIATRQQWDECRSSSVCRSICTPVNISSIFFHLNHKRQRFFALEFTCGRPIFYVARAVYHGIILAVASRPKTVSLFQPIQMPHVHAFGGQIPHLHATDKTPSGTHAKPHGRCKRTPVTF